ncbi:hypothetical protein QF004_001831 [Chryseobacterium sp. MDT2-18]|uniref:Uncharacterized protein n=1 Tax=Chryseobacterium salivictor TaxID=2547600 RepID=A0A4P6ZI57_9FLAO|nr:hypothetical protein [Chryseobacterium sp. MDT2-18]QBO59379.1 hypothetical protein NBC122_02575 [Chryseobacterium salivictor]
MSKKHHPLIKVWNMHPGKRSLIPVIIAFLLTVLQVIAP